MLTKTMEMIDMKPITFCAERLPNGEVGRHLAVDLARYPHALVVGATNSGKSIASMLIAAKISLHFPDSKIWILDFKGDSDTFDFSDGVPGCRYWKYMDCMEGLADYFTMFQERLAHDPGPNAGLNLLWADEYPSFILNLAKKDAESAKSMLSTVLMMGRQKRCMALTTAQKAMAEIYAQGARDNYNICLAMSNISKESAAMLGFDREAFCPVTEIGGGHLLLSGTNQTPVQIPYIGPRGMARMKDDILKAVIRNNDNYNRR